MEPSPWVFGLFGLVIGSFLNVCIYRIPRGESIVFPSSRCPNCGTAIRPSDNIPVLSYVLLGGKCRSCRAPISLQYPAVELLCSAAFFSCAVKWGVDPPAFLNCLFLAVIIVLVFIDYRHQILPNVVTLPAAISGLVLSHFQTRAFFLDRPGLGLASMLLPDDPGRAVNWTGSILGALVGGGILYLVAVIYRVIRKQQGLGMGDVKMMAMVGAFLGWRLALLTIFAGSFLGSLAGIFLILFRGQNLQSKLAFGTFLGMGAALSLFFGLSFLHWYASIR